MKSKRVNSLHRSCSQQGHPSQVIFISITALEMPERSRDGQSFDSNLTKVQKRRYVYTEMFYQDNVNEE